MSDYTPKKLAQALVEKHTRLISEYSDEVEKSKQITMLREKKDQLHHWVEENGSKGKYQKELEETEKELTTLQSSFKPKNQTHYAGLKERIEEHKKARDHWLGVIGETKS
jgi:flagellar biosynthesis chaperone FliJ